MDIRLAQQLFQQTQEGYDRIAGHFAQTRQAPWREVQVLLEQYVHAGDSLLDIGCGNGRVADLANTIKADYIGIDISKELIDLAIQQHPQNTFHVGSMLQTDFTVDSFDHAILVASFHHIPSDTYRLEALQEIRRITKPHGMIMMLNWNLHQWHFFTKRLRANAHKLLQQHEMDWDDLLVPWKNAQGDTIIERYYHAFTIKEIHRLAKDADLDVVEQYYETNGQRLPRYKAYNLVSILQKPEEY